MTNDEFKQAQAACEDADPPIGSVEFSPACVRCGGLVRMGLETNWNYGDWCEACLATLGKLARTALPKALEEIERLRKLAPEWRSAADDPPKFEGVVQVVQEGSLNETIACYYDTEFHEPDVVLWCPLTQGPEVTT